MHIHAILRLAKNEDAVFIKKYDPHISERMILKKIKEAELFIISQNNTLIGFLRYNLFWDEIPFMNMLFVVEQYRQQGFGKQLVNYWEADMKEKGYSKVMTSTVEHEDAKYFYEKLGYKIIGAFQIPKEPNEIILSKAI